MTALNTQFRLWIASTTAGKIVLAGWTAVATTAKGITLLLAATKAPLTKNDKAHKFAIDFFNTYKRVTDVIR